MPQHADIAIIGAGAAGLAAGIFAAETNPSIRIILLDGAKTIGAKILVSGGGRCNVTNQRVTASDFHGNLKVIDRRTWGNMSITLLQTEPEPVFLLLH